MSVTPLSQKRFMTSVCTMSISPRPLSFAASQNTPYTPVPEMSLSSVTPEYTLSKSHSSSTTGTTADSISACALSPCSRGSMLAAGKASMASACLLAMALKSHALTGSICSRSPPRRRRHSHWRSLYHCWLSIMRFSRFALPALYFSSV